MAESHTRPAEHGGDHGQRRVHQARQDLHRSRRGLGHRSRIPSRRYACCSFQPLTIDGGRNTIHDFNGYCSNISTLICADDKRSLLFSSTSS